MCDSWQKFRSSKVYKCFPGHTTVCFSLHKDFRYVLLNLFFPEPKHVKVVIPKLTCNQDFFLCWCYMRHSFVPRRNRATHTRLYVCAHVCVPELIGLQGPTLMVTLRRLRVTTKRLHLPLFFLRHKITLTHTSHTHTHTHTHAPTVFMATHQRHSYPSCHVAFFSIGFFQICHTFVSPVIQKIQLWIKHVHVFKINPSVKFGQANYSLFPSSPDLSSLSPFNVRVMTLSLVLSCSSGFSFDPLFSSSLREDGLEKRCCSW